MLLLRVCLTTCLAASLWYFYSAYFLTSIVETRFHDISLNSYTKKEHHIMSFFKETVCIVKLLDNIVNFPLFSTTMYSSLNFPINADQRTDFH